MLMSIPYRNILLPLDGSEIAAQALPHALEMATQSGAKLVLFQVIPAQGDELSMTTEMQVTQPGLERQQTMVDQAGDTLQRLADDLTLHKIPATVMLDVGAPAAQILDYAANHEIDLIVMSSHGRTGLARWTYGSVAGKVLSTAPCPVLLVRAEIDKQ
jgi:nucleotide-binding universal stress UspA family protein